jgi:hypothetical protein
MSQKEIAIQCLKRLGVYQPYIRKFEKDGVPVFYERSTGFYADQEPVLWAKIKEIQETYNVLVYCLTHDWFDFGECWSMMCIQKNIENLEDYIMEAGTDTFYVFSYVWNEDHDCLSEFGSVVMKSYDGNLRRLG